MNESQSQTQGRHSTADATSSNNGNDYPQWFVMRDLKRSNAKLPAYKLFKDLGIEVFTPMIWRLVVKNGKRCREEVPFMQDMLFVHAIRQTIDSIIEKHCTVQFRYVRGGYKIPMTVREPDMERFIHAVESAGNPYYYAPDEISSDMIGKKVRIVGGPLNGYEGYLQKMQVARTKRLLIELPHLLTATVEVQPEYIQLI